MRILHVAESFGGGLLEVVRLLAEGGAARGDDTAIAYGVRPETPASVREAIASQVELFPMPWTSRTPAAQVRAARQLRSLVRDWHPDVVHLHSSFAGLVGALILRGGRPVTVYSPHAYASALPNEGSPAYRAAVRLAEQVASRRVDVVGAISTSEARFARERAGARRVTVVENGIPELDADRLAEREPPSRPRVIAAGRTVPQRRPDACARILVGVRDLAEVAWIGGGGGSRGEAGHRALVNAGIEPSGWVDRPVVLDELRRSTAYLHWTSWDGQPLSILEALATDTVVVASDIEPNRDILGDEQVRSTEAEAVELLRRIVTDPQFAERLRRRQREIRGRWSAERMIEQWLGVYAELAGRHGRPARAGG